MKRFFHLQSLKYWLLQVVLLTGLCGLLYAAVQQDLRQSANDPQIQLAEDTSAKLTGGQQIQDVVLAEKVDIAHSLAPYLIIFDAEGKPIAASGQLNDQMPSIPTGVFDYLKSHDEDRFTWQPQTGVRSAVVVTPFKGPSPSSGYVLAGRSLREVEQRETNIRDLILAGWLGMLLVTFLATVLLLPKERPGKRISRIRRPSRNP